MNQLPTEQIASQHIDELQKTAARARLARQAQAVRTERQYAAFMFIRLIRAGAAIRHWFARAQLGPANNYVTH